MFTIRFDGKEHDVFQFSDMTAGDIFSINDDVFVKVYNSFDDAKRRCNAINLKYRNPAWLDDDDVVSPITLEWSEWGDEDVL